MPLWPFLRVPFFTRYLYDNAANVQPSLGLAWKLLPSLLFGFRQYFKKYDYIYFSTTNNRRKIGDQYWDRADVVKELFPKTLILETPQPRHYEKGRYPHAAASRLPLIAIETILAKFINRRLKLTGSSILADLQNELSKPLGARGLACRYLAQEKVMRWVIKLYRPKAVFFVVPYINSGYVRACSQAGIPTLEFQHGIITRAHFGYAVTKNVDSSAYVDYLLSFGKVEKEMFGDDLHYVKSSHVLPVGSLFVEKMRDHFVPHQGLAAKIQKYSLSVAISLQDPFEDSLIPFLKQAANQMPEVLFLMLPRHKREADYQKYELPSNVVFEPAINSYQGILQCDIHSTINSTMAIEALFLGRSNVLINVHNYAKDYFLADLPESDINHYADSPEGYVQILKDKHFGTPEECVAMSERFIASDFKTKVQDAVHFLFER
ncbi:MAG TPA: hypothetical protein DCR93_18780 [Cytophagales bacterium]|nr:hypothetical protein [Cytophagales bacterium]